MFGSYIHDSSTPLPVYFFMAENVLKICRGLLNINPLAIIGDADNLFATKRKSKDHSVFVTVISQKDANGKKIKRDAVVFDTESHTFESVLEQVGNDNFFVALWAVIIHETRHLIQKYFFKSDQTKFMGLRDFKMIHQHNPDLANWILNRYNATKYPTYRIKRSEFDAIVIECLATTTMIQTFDGHNIDYRKLLQLLLFDRQDIELLLTTLIPPQMTEVPKFNLTYSFDLPHPLPITLELT